MFVKLIVAFTLFYPLLAQAPGYTPPTPKCANFNDFPGAQEVRSREQCPALYPGFEYICYVDAVTGRIMTNNEIRLFTDYENCEAANQPCRSFCVPNCGSPKALQAKELVVVKPVPVCPLLNLVNGPPNLLYTRVCYNDIDPGFCIPLTPFGVIHTGNGYNPLRVLNGK